MLYLFRVPGKKKKKEDEEEEEEEEEEEMSFYIYFSRNITRAACRNCDRIEPKRHEN